jgi:hypothetical protein
MIVLALFGVLAAILTFAVGLFPALPDVSAATSGIQTAIGTIMGYAASLGVWLPFSTAGAALTIILAVFGVACIIYVVRLVVSLFTGGGGSPS